MIITINLFHINKCQQEGINKIHQLRKQQNLMTTRLNSNLQKSYSPLNKDTKAIGKLFNRHKEIVIQDNPEEVTPQISFTHIKSMGVNTSKIGIQYAPEIELIEKKDEEIHSIKEQKNPQMKLHSSVFDIKFKNQVKNQEIGKPMEKTEPNTKLQKSSIGIIRRQHKSAPKDFGSKLSETSPQLPSINKIQKNVSGFRSFVDTSVSSPEQKIKNPLTSRANSRLQFVRKSRNMDSQQNQKLHKYHYNRATNNRSANSRIKLPTFKDQSKVDFSQFQNTYKSQHFQSSQPSKITQSIHHQHQQNKIQQIDPTSHSRYPMEQINHHQFQQKSSSNAQYTQNHANAFIVSRINQQLESHVSIDLRTSISKLKQILVESQNQLHTSFVVPQIFFNPPSSSSTSQELHMLMLEVFSHIGITPQIVSIKKYVNCVVLREKNLCILWNFNGKIYFGGWKRGDNMSEGNKHGIGIQWIPSRYIYYGEFKDNKKEGYGIMKKSNKEVYIGCWKNNQRWGWGKLYDPDGFLHQNGEFVEGCFVSENRQDN